MRLYFFALAFAALTGCATVGKEVTPDQLTDFKPGTTTVADVVSKLGAPTSSSATSNGYQTLMYIYAHAQARPASFIPIIGPLVGGTDSHSSSVIFMFGADGRLIRYMASQSQLGASTGLAAGPYRAPIADQPSTAPPTAPSPASEPPLAAASAPPK
jgi:outer membrane protein assembly factor BamE (lipoprotein component of BamABCDE complex)